MDDDKEQPVEETQTPAPEAETGDDKPQPETPADDNGGGESTADTDRLADIENRLTALESLTSEKFGILDKMREGMAEHMLDGDAHDDADDDGTPDGADDDPDGVNMTLDDIFD